MKTPDSIQITVLGCGTSTGVPLIHCSCKVCKSRNPKNKRLRASIWIQTQNKSVLIDTSTDLRQQAIRARIPRLDAVLYTHPHTDHIHGIDELRSFNFAQKARIPVFGNSWTQQELFQRFPYIFSPNATPQGGGIPLLDFHLVGRERFQAAGVDFEPISVMHGSNEVLAYRIRSVAYVTDCSYIPEDSLARLEGLDVLILDCIRIQPHPTHFNVDQALEVVRRVKPKKTFLTHLGHEFDYAEWMRKLPKGVALAYDGMKIQQKYK